MVTSTGQVARLSRQLFIETMGRNHSCNSEFLSIQKFLFTKAWLIHCVAMLSRVIWPIFKLSYWQKAYEGRKELKDKFDDEFVTATKPYVIPTIISLIVLGIVLDVIVWRRRHLAQWIFYYECLSNIVQAFAPFDYGSFSNLFWLMLTI